VILPITDPYVVHHGALGSFATIYLDESEREVVALALAEMEGIEVGAPQRRRPAGGFELPRSAWATWSWSRPPRGARHERARATTSPVLDAPLRSHGGLSEQTVPLLFNRVATVAEGRRLRNFDILDVALNRSPRNRDGSALRAGQDTTVRAIERIRRRWERSPRAGRAIEVADPYTREVVGAVPKATVDDVRRAIAAAAAYRPVLTRYQRCHRPAARLAELLRARRGHGLRPHHARVGTLQEGLDLRGRARLRRAHLQRHGGAEGRRPGLLVRPHAARQEPPRLHAPRAALGVISAITPFNHPMNQVAHKVAPSIATNNRMVLKPSEKTPMSAIYLAELLYEAGCPREMFQVITGTRARSPTSSSPTSRSDLVTFTGGVGGRQGRSPRRRATAASSSSSAATTRSSSWRMPTSTRPPRSPRRARTRTAASAARPVKRILVHERVAAPFVDCWWRRRSAWNYGEPHGPQGRHGHRDRRAGGEALRSARERGDLRRARGSSSATSAKARSIARP
jgi:hypothetical protein